MMNVYNGNVTLDSEGVAVVEMPEWFEALNREFHYQLTPIGAPAPMLHVARRVEDNSWEIAGGPAGVTVSWQLTGVRKDRFAESNRIPTEVMKDPEERGHYLHPEAFGVPKERGIAHKRAVAAQRAAREE
jgi:hypothetical protein